MKNKNIPSPAEHRAALITEIRSHRAYYDSERQMAIAAKVDPGEWGKIFTRMPPEKRKGVSIERLHKILEILVKDQKGK